jgi:hypothetical protein
MGIEVADSAAVLAADHRGVPTRMTNMADVERDAQLPPPQVVVNCPVGYSHGGPPIENPYTNRRSNGDE